MRSAARYDRVIQTVCLLILAGIALAAALYWLRPVMIPFVMALFVAFTLSPVVDFQVRRWKFPRPLAITSALILGVAILIAAALLATAAVAQMTANASSYEKQFGKLMDNAIENLPLEKVGIDPDELRRNLGVKRAATDASPDVLPDAVDASPGALPDAAAAGAGDPGAGGATPLRQPRSLDRPDSAATEAAGFSFFSPVAVRNLLEAIAGTVANVISQGTLVLVFLLFLLAGDTALSGSRGGSFGESALTVRHYVTTAVFISAITGFFVGLSLWLLGVEMALTFGFLAFVLNFVPNLGSIVATLLPLPIVLLGDDPGYLQAALALGVPGAIQIIIGNFVTPKIMGRSLNLHPITFLIALIFWGMLWGLVGVLLAVPITAVIRIWLAKSSYTRPVANIMAGRAPFDPPATSLPAVPQPKTQTPAPAQEAAPAEKTSSTA